MRFNRFASAGDKLDVFYFREGAQASALVYSVAATACANGL